MSYDIPHHWEREIEQIAQAQHITPDEAVNRIVEAGVKSFQPPPSSGSTPPWPSVTRAPNLKVAEECPIFGVFADKPEFQAEIERIVAGRGKRYAQFT